MTVKWEGELLKCDKCEARLSQYDCGPNRIFGKTEYYGLLSVKKVKT